MAEQSEKKISKLSRLKKAFTYLCFGIIGLCLVTLGHAGYRQYTGNFHEVVPGAFYRSAQPSPIQIATYQQQYGIRTIINLRDEAKGPWLEEEEETAEKLGIKLIHLPLSSSKPLSVAQAEQIAQMMEELPKPILVHCEHGANRTGLVSAICVDAVADESDFEATLQLSPYFGHFPIPKIGRYAMFSSYIDFQKNSDM